VLLVFSIMPPSSGRPKDGAAIIFEADAHVRLLVNRKFHDASKEVQVDEFGLVLVAGWPPNKDKIGPPYQQLLEIVRSCFDEVDLSGPDAAVYLYSPEYLHVTVATLHAFTLGTKTKAERENLKRHWTAVVKAAAKRPDWPKEPFQLEIESSQIGTKAGILLWKETTGGMDQMRRCIDEQVLQNGESLKAAGIDRSTLSIPGITHSTFLRFNKVPNTSGEMVQSRYKELVAPKLAQLFSEPLTLTDARFICERIPYMHIPNDKDHVLDVFELR